MKAALDVEPADERTRPIWRTAALTVRLLLVALTAAAMVAVLKWDYLVAGGIFGAESSGSLQLTPATWNLAAYLPLLLVGWPTRRRETWILAPVGALVQLLLFGWVEFGMGRRAQLSDLSRLLLEAAIVLLFVLGVSLALAMLSMRRKVPWALGGLVGLFVAGTSYSLVGQLQASATILWMVVGGVVVGFAIRGFRPTRGWVGITMWASFVGAVFSLCCAILLNMLIL